MTFGEVNHIEDDEAATTLPLNDVGDGLYGRLGGRRSAWLRVRQRSAAHQTAFSAVGGEAWGSVRGCPLTFAGGSARLTHVLPSPFAFAHFDEARRYERRAGNTGTLVRQSPGDLQVWSPVGDPEAATTLPLNDVDDGLCGRQGNGGRLVFRSGSRQGL